MINLNHQQFQGYFIIASNPFIFIIKSFLYTDEFNLHNHINKLAALLFSTFKQMKQQRMFKIISLTKQQPIFLYKNMGDTTTFRQFTQSLVSPKQLATPSIKVVQQKLSQITDKLSKNQSKKKINLLGNRSISCELTSDSPFYSDGGKQNESKNKLQRSIKQYLRIAYRRAQKQKRSSIYKLPGLINHQNSQHLQQKDYNNKKAHSYRNPITENSNNNHQNREDNDSQFGKLSSINKIMKRKRRIYSKSKQNSMDHCPRSNRAQVLSGWDNYSINDQF